MRASAALGLALLSVTTTLESNVAFSTNLALAVEDPCDLQTNNRTVDRVFMVAEEVCRGNIQPYLAGLLQEPARVLMAGARYPSPWTRDGSINTWNGIELIFPGVGKNTMLSLLQEQDGKISITGQVFDDIVWVPAAWAEYLYSGDKDFLKAAFGASLETLRLLENKMFDSQIGLFQGPGVSCDVSSGYPDNYAARRHPVTNMHALSTNCAYYAAYTTLELMAKELNSPIDPSWSKKAKALKACINEKFWNESRGTYRYIVDSENGDDSQESIGLALAILYDIPDKARVKAIFDHVQTCKYGIPCLWPPFPRFARAGGFGNHSGLLWPFMQGFWADACKRAGRPDLFDSEFTKLTEISLRDGWFCQSYDPVSGTPSGGTAATRNNQPINTASRPDQSWSATGYLRMVLMGILGMNFEPDGIRFEPHLPTTLTDVKLNNFRYRKAILDIRIKARGDKISSFSIDGKRSLKCFFSSDQVGKHTINMVMTN